MAKTNNTVGVIDFLSSSAPDLPSKDQIKKLCEKQRQEVFERGNPLDRDNHLTYTHQGQKVFIKYDTTASEWRNQQFLVDKINQRADLAIRIPEIYACFGTRDDLYIIMQFIEIDHIASDAQRAKALAELVSITPPVNATPGPLGGGPVNMGTFWAHGLSDTEYTSVQALESHMNRVLEEFKMPHQERHKVDFSLERMICCYTAIHRSHFLVDADDQLWVVAFRQVNILPESFMAFALRKQLGGDPLPREYHSLIPIEHTTNLKAVYAARRWFLSGSSVFLWVIFPDFLGFLRTSLTEVEINKTNT